MSDKAILDGKTVIPVADPMEWALWYGYAVEKRRVAENHIGDVRISTVFLGIDHNIFGPKPLWFETMIFGGRHDQYQKRYSTWDEAEAGHAKAVKLVEAKP